MVGRTLRVAKCVAERAAPSLPSALRDLPRLAAQAARDRWSQEALAQEEEVSVGVHSCCGSPVCVCESAHAARATHQPPLAERAPAIALPSCAPRYELGRQPANTKLSSHKAVRPVRVRGGNHKVRALRLDHGNFSWGSEVSVALLLASARLGTVAAVAFSS